MNCAQPENENRLLDALGSLIANHADWLDGRSFQRLTTQAAQAYFPEEELDIFVTPVEFAQVVEKALTYAIQDKED